jgi:hypothetical protein
MNWDENENFCSPWPIFFPPTSITSYNTNHQSALLIQIIFNVNFS